MRQRYDYLTTETEKTLDGNVKAAAYGLGKSSEAVYQIVRCEAVDPFAHFLSFYEGLAIGGVPRTEYRQRLDFIDSKYDGGQRTCEPSEAFTDKFRGHNVLFEQYLAAIADGSIDAAECERLLDLVAIEKPLVIALESALNAHKVKLENAK